MLNSKSVDIFFLASNLIGTSAFRQKWIKTENIYMYSLIFNLRSYFDWIDWMSSFFSLSIYLSLWRRKKRKHSQIQNISNLFEYICELEEDWLCVYVFIHANIRYISTCFHWSTKKRKQPNNRCVYVDVYRLSCVCAFVCMERLPFTALW